MFFFHRWSSIVQNSAKSSRKFFSLAKGGEKCEKKKGKRKIEFFHFGNAAGRFNFEIKGTFSDTLLVSLGIQAGSRQLGRVGHPLESV